MLLAPNQDAVLKLQKLACCSKKHFHERQRGNVSWVGYEVIYGLTPTAAVAFAAIADCQYAWSTCRGHSSQNLSLQCQQDVISRHRHFKQGLKMSRGAGIAAVLQSFVKWMTGR